MQDCRNYKVVVCKDVPTKHKSVFSFLCQPTTWQAAAVALLLLASGPPSVQQLIGISCPPGPQQQTRRI